MDKYDEAIDFLNKEDEKRGGGTYFGECAELMAELLFQIYELEQKKQKPLKRTKYQREHDKEIALINKAAHKRHLAYSARSGSSAKAAKE